MSDLAVADRKPTRLLQWIGDYTGPFALLMFGVVIWYFEKSENLFTFAAWGTLDFCTGLSMIYAGHAKAARLPVAYGVIAIFVTLIIYKNGQWQWTIVETTCLIGATIAFYCWSKYGATAGTVAFGAAMSIASIPILVDNFYMPNMWEWFLWIGSAVSATIGLYLSWPWKFNTIAEWLFVWISEVVTILMLLLLFWPR